MKKIIGFLFILCALATSAAYAHNIDLNDYYNNDIMSYNHSDHDYDDSHSHNCC